MKKLRNTEETLLIELLDLTADDIVDAFLDRISERYEYIHAQYEEDFTEE